MPGKSRHGRGKHPHHSKKSKAIKRQTGISSPQQSTAVTPEPSVPAQAPPAGAPVAPKAAAAPADVTTSRYPYVAGELKRIGILAGIIIVVLIVLSIVL